MSAPILDAAATLQSARALITAADGDDSAVRAEGRLNAAAQLVELAKAEALIEQAKQQRIANLLGIVEISPRGSATRDLALMEAEDLLGVPTVTS